MSSALSPPHPHNLSPVRVWELRGRTTAAQGGMAAGPAAPGAPGQRGRLNACHSSGEGEKGVSALGTGLSSSGDCPEDLGMPRNSRGEKGLGSSNPLRVQAAGSGQNTLSWVKFSKIPSADALPQLLQPLPVQPWAR